MYRSLEIVGWEEKEWLATRSIVGGKEHHKTFYASEGRDTVFSLCEARTA
jgi:hypothetical protein